MFRFFIVENLSKYLKLLMRKNQINYIFLKNTDTQSTYKRGKNILKTFHNFKYFCLYLNLKKYNLLKKFS